MVVVAAQMQFASARLVPKQFFQQRIKKLYFRTSLKMPIGINAWMSMECHWQDAFTTVKIMLTAKLTASLSSRAALPIVPVRLVKLQLLLYESYRMTLFKSFEFI